MINLLALSQRKSLAYIFVQTTSDFLKYRVSSAH
jgi:hypothetical protein